MKILFASSEASPFAKSGGLGDVAQSLPETLSKQKNTEVLLFLPMYKRIKQNEKIKTEFIKSFAVNLSWRQQHVGVFRLVSRKKKLRVYFIDNEYYFNRANLYGYADDGERFAFFSKAILESMVQLGETADIIHCNDWQTALIPVLLHAFYHDTLGNAKTVFTIHNIEYQGKCDKFFLGDVLGLSDEYESTLSFGGCLNFMKGAILKSDAVTTVSKTYADEIKYPYYSHGLDSIIAEHSFKLHGIVNGIDCSLYDPLKDENLFCNFDFDSYKTGKNKNKKELQRILGLPQKNVAMVGMVSRLVEHKGTRLLCNILDDFANWDMQLVILGTGDFELEDKLKYFEAKYPDKISLNLKFDAKLASRIYASSDFYLMPSKSEPCGLSQLIAMRYGTVPVVNCTGGLKDTVEPFDITTGEGTGFNFRSFTEWDLTDALRRAFETYGAHKSDFAKLVGNCMKKDSSWDNSAKEYLKLYSQIVKSNV